MPDRKKRRPEKRNAEPSPYVPGGRNPCSECGSSGRIKKTELVLNSRLRHMLCGICGHRWTLAERRPQEELDAEYAATLRGLEHDVRGTAEALEYRKGLAATTMAAVADAQRAHAEAVQALAAFRRGKA